MDGVLWDFLEKFPTASIAAAASVEEVAQVVAPLGLQERRPVAIIRFSRESSPECVSTMNERGLCDPPDG